MVTTVALVMPAAWLWACLAPANPARPRRAPEWRAGRRVRRGGLTGGASTAPAAVARRRARGGGRAAPLAGRGLADGRLRARPGPGRSRVRDPVLVVRRRLGGEQVEHARLLGLEPTAAATTAPGYRGDQ